MIFHFSRTPPASFDAEKYTLSPCSCPSKCMADFILNISLRIVTCSQANAQLRHISIDGVTLKLRMIPDALFNVGVAGGVAEGRSDRNVFTRSQVRILRIIKRCR
nr:hypothetical protein CFP56_02776 [Quercus suber]